MRGADRWPKRFAGITIEAGRDVDGENAVAGGIDSRRDLVVGRFERAAQASAEQGIDDPGRRLNISNQLVAKALVLTPDSRGSQAHRVASPKQNVVLGRVVRELGFGRERVSTAGHCQLGKGIDVDGISLGIQMPRDHEAVAAVIAGAAQDQRRLLLRVQTHQQFGAAAAGVLHEHDAGNAELLDRPAVEFANLDHAKA